MKRTIALMACAAIIATGMVVALPGISVAGVTGTVHDLPAFYSYTGTEAKMGTCSFCHVPHKADGGGEKLFPQPYAGGLPAAWSSDSLSNFCWFCHGASSGFGSAVEVNPFQGTNHKRDSTLLTAGIKHPGDPGDMASVPTDLDLTAGDLRCISCHSIHDNTKKPFVAWGTNGVFDATGTGFCGKCHLNRSNAAVRGTGVTNHPSASTYADTDTDDSPVVGTGLPQLMQVNTDWTDPIAGGWNLGGKALSTGGTESTTGMICGSCHAVHSNEDSATWASDADGTTPVATAVTTAGDPILVAAAAPTTAQQSAPICEACHSIVYGSGVRGPGAATTYSHPVGTAGTLHDTIAGSAGYRWGNDGTNARIICQSCHDIHWSGTNEITTGATNDYLLAQECEGCHSVSGSSVAGHHPSNITGANGLVNGTATAETTAGAGTNWVAGSQTNDGVNYWADSTTMTCTTCHGLGEGTAHNNANSFPGLTGDNTESDMCVDCHGFNPSTYTTATQGTATHYVGEIDTAVANYKFTDAWTDTGGASKWSPDDGTGTEGSIICESCHSVQIVGKNESGLTSPDPGIITSLAATNNVGDGVGDTPDSITLMLSTMGNMDAVTTVAGYGCTECHGSNPGGNVSHPVLPAFTAVSSMSPATPATSTSGTGATGQINCESCHRPHDASTASGAWILEAASAGTGYTDYSPVCALCHTGQY